jgi:lipoprotein-releasing system permease protein
MSYTLLIARRYLTAKRKTGFISLIASISISGVALGAAALIITLCIISGFEKEMKSKFIGFDAHVRLKTFEGTTPITDASSIESLLQSVDEVEAVSPYVEKEAMIRSRHKAEGIIVKGIREDRARDVLSIEKDLLASIDPGRIRLERSGTGELPGIVIGKKLADKLQVRLGDKVTLFSLRQSMSFVEQPRVRQFSVAGIYRSGLAEYDNVTVYVDLTDAQTLFDYGSALTGFEIRLKQLEHAEEVSEFLGRKLGYPYYSRTWRELHRSLFSWLETNNFVMMVIFSLIIVVAAFNIVGTLFMIVIEKTRDIGILRSLGARKRHIRQVFLMEGALIGALGGGLGSLIALVLCSLQRQYRLVGLNSDVYFMDSVPVDMQGNFFAIITAFAVLLCILAAVFPSLRAAHMDPVDAIRYE